ncbi:hypothetical protein C7B65_23820 [Phormidesmis priestleyi ULC007]|uniref:DUF2808 domain-containing protein n=1 Tax=Phormidesmis priestleyi ULC007 TaxID=1920490 RepID=A0A2T1D592_9CYAN|nr:hypothetical protein [Phormidesmis priestleyi]PSB15692.1 hypothetical protein C7B65_23820 [Phormidesmis priestleyi ULC007]PZO45958.1 MAG: hypothetical protein DCF14_24170 [Phormidesmis priestleyi]
MKRFIYGGISALVLATTAITPGLTAPAPDFRAIALNQMQFNFTAPFISSSGLLGDHHVIRVMVVGMSLEDLMIRIPSGMSKYGQVKVTDESGKEVPAKITATKDQVAIAFSQPVEPGHILEVDIPGIQTYAEAGNILLYGITAKRVGISGQIPVGTARIQVPDRS